MPYPSNRTNGIHTSGSLCCRRVCLLDETPAERLPSDDVLAGLRAAAAAWVGVLPRDAARYLCAAFIGVIFEAWSQWAAGEDANPAP